MRGGEKIKLKSRSNQNEDENSELKPLQSAITQALFRKTILLYVNDIEIINYESKIWSTVQPSSQDSLLTAVAHKCTKSNLLRIPLN